VPQLSFGDHCDEGELFTKGGKQTGLQLGCSSLKEDIAYCQSKGIKVLLSIGGPDSSRSSLALGSADKGAEFADWLLNAFGPKQDSYKGPRPFDRDGEAPTVLDGFDFDLGHMVGE
jgi:chitinase